MTVAAVATERRWLTAVVVASGCLALAYKPVTYGATWTILAVGCAGIVVPLPSARATRARWIAATLTGLTAFSIGRVLGAPLGIRYTALGIAVIVLAAICEEAFFRRFVYGILTGRYGDTTALVCSSVLFAVVHVPLYGWRAFPIDLAAGFVLGWQRMTTGSWSSSAAVHVVANLMQMG